MRARLQRVSAERDRMRTERDAARAELEANRQRWAKQLEGMQQMLGQMQDTAQGQPEGQHPLIFDRFMDASDSGLSPVSHMTLEELQAECVVRGLAQSGGLAAVRGRVRVARARERQSLKL
ncbi:unnamed protein product [Effrenium voratum]|uniref:Uncharacterized protein n=1 Tax=Effrenium voratum TaxID=2562239 RepID=A0AA36J0B6_9DINO|nr:unnamed protein product [Effrenium voratum]CAJ1446628.1 unnamed protein product [Effrenium voratum]